MPSPSKPSDFSNLVLTSSSTLCDRFKAALLTLPSKLYDFVNYVLDANGNPSKTFAKDLLSNTGIWSIGDLKSTLSSTTPDGWIDCEGQTLSRTIYSDLFSVVYFEYFSNLLFNLFDSFLIFLILFILFKSILFINLKTLSIFSSSDF